jgi:hypothetical protein
MTLFIIVATIPLVFVALTLWIGLPNIMKIGAQAESAVEIFEEAEDRINKEHGQFYFWVKLTQSIVDSVLIGTFITFWVAWYLGMFK